MNGDRDRDRDRDRSTAKPENKAAARPSGLLPAPNPKELAGLLETLYGLTVDVRSDPREPALATGALGVYASADETARVLLHFDPTLAASLAAALTRVPAGAAEEAVKNKQLPENLLENLREVTNVLGRLVASPWGQLRIQTTTGLPGPLPPPVTKALGERRRLASFLVTVAGYRAGLLTVLEVGPFGPEAAAREEGANK